MSRLGLIVRNPKMALGALATVGVAASLTVGSGAFIADQEASEGNSVQAGTADIHMFGAGKPVIDGNNCRSTTDAFVAVANETKDCLDGGVKYTAAKTATFTVSNLSPGQPKISRCFVVASSSDVPMGIRLDIDSFEGSQALAQVLNLKISRDGSQAPNPMPTPAPQFGDYTRIYSKFGTVAQGTLADLKAAPAAIADFTYVANGEREAFEPNEAARYCVELTLTNEAKDQQEIEGQSVKFAINAIGQSIYGTDLDTERSNDL